MSFFHNCVGAKVSFSWRHPFLIILSATVPLLAACSTSPQLRAERFDCRPPAQGTGWVKTQGSDELGGWLEYANTNGVRYIGRRISAGQARGRLENFFDGDAGNLVDAFNGLRDVLDRDVSDLSLVELEFSDSNTQPEAILVVDIERESGRDRRSVMIRSGNGHVDLIQLGGAGTEPEALRKTLLGYATACTAVVI